MSGHGAGHGGGRRKKHEEHEEHENHERWLVSYADMMTLLMVLFIVMFAISAVDQRKFNELKDGLAGSFGAPVTVTNGGEKPLDSDKLTTSVITVGVPNGPVSNDPDVEQAVKTKEQADQRAAASERSDRVAKEVGKLEAARKQILAALAAKKLSGSVKFRYDERGLVVTIVTDEVIFPADRAELAPAGHRVLDVIAPTLRELPNDLSIEGHTNTAKVKPKYYPTEWELSSARAVNVLRDLVDRDHIAPRRISATGYGETRPLEKGTTPHANRVNRRVEIVVLTTLSGEDRPLLPKIAPVPSDG